nr:hypothetical protein [Tanacetum cinerariifolium]
SICHECGEIGYWKMNYPHYLAELLKMKKNAASGAGGSCISVIELNTILNRSWIYDTGCSTHICNTTQDLRASKKLKLGALSLYEVEKQPGKTIKSLRSDRRGEYISQEFLDHLKDHGIIAHRTPPYTPQHNGVSERRNRTLLDMVRSMMSQITLPKSFWDYALETAARILNMVPTKKVEKTPYEVWHGKAHRLEEGQSVSSYVLKMKGYIDNIERLGHPVTLGLGVSLILIGLRKEYDGFVQNYNMHNMGKTINELHAMLKLYEQTLPKSNAPALNAIRAGKVRKGNKHKKSQSQIATKGQNRGKEKNKQAYAPKPKIPLRLKGKIPQRTQYVMSVGLRASRKVKLGALSLYVRNGQRKAVEAIGAFYLCLHSGLEIVLNNCHYAPSITRGVIYVSRLYEDGFVNLFVDNTIQVSRNNVVYFIDILRDGIFEIDLSNSLTNESSIYVVSNKRAKLDLDYALLWHCQLGHISKKRIEKLQHDGLLDSSDLRAFEICVPCMSGKLARKPYTHQVERAKDLLGLIHTNVCGPFKIMSRQGASYFVTFTDYFSRYGYVYLLKHKHEVFETFKVFQKEVENQLGKTIKSLRSDRVDEYISQEFLDHLKDHGIIAHRTPPYTPQHNGVSERRNRTILDMVRSMMSQTTLPKSFWDYALETATRIINIVPTKKVEKTPYEVWHGKAKSGVDTQRKRWDILSNTHPRTKSTRTRHAPDHMCLYIDAEEHELRDLDNEVWVLVELPPNSKTVGSKWLFKKKTDMDGNVYIYKARLVAKGYTQTPWIDYEETFSPVADIRAIRILIAIVAYYDYEIWQMDVKTAFLNGYLNEEVYMEKPEGFVNPKYLNREKLKLSKSQGASTLAELKRMQNVSYASAVGSIMYAVRCTRPDVANTKDMFLVYGGDLKRELRVFCYTDAGYLTDVDDLKSQTGYVFILNGGAVDWKSAKQSIFATSSAEAEHIAAFDASKEAVCVRKFISGLGVVPTIEEPISMYYDNTRAIAIANEFGITKGARHFRVKVHYLREVIEFGDIKLEKVHTDDNLADPFTKSLAFPIHSEHTRNIGILPASSLIDQIDQNDEDTDLSKKRELLASLIEKLKCEINESKNHNKFLETSNKVLIDKLKSEIKDFKNKNNSLELSNNQFKEANNKLSKENDLLYADFKKSQAELKQQNSIEYASQMELECEK